MRKLELNTGELLEMRKQGMSNAEIAKSLDVSVPTITRRIGTQRQRGEKLKGISKLPPAEQEAQIMMITQQMAVNGFTFFVNHGEKTVGINSPTDSYGGIFLNIDQLDDLMSALEAVIKICRTE